MRDPGHCFKPSRTVYRIMNIVLNCILCPGSRTLFKTVYCVQDQEHPLWLRAGILHSTARHEWLQDHDGLLQGWPWEEVTTKIVCVAHWQHSWLQSQQLTFDSRNPSKSPSNLLSASGVVATGFASYVGAKIFFSQLDENRIFKLSRKS